MTGLGNGLSETKAKAKADSRQRECVEKKNGKEN